WRLGRLGDDSERLGNDHNGILTLVGIPRVLLRNFCCFCFLLETAMICGKIPGFPECESMVIRIRLDSVVWSFWRGVCCPVFVVVLIFVRSSLLEYLYERVGCSSNLPLLCR